MALAQRLGVSEVEVATLGTLQEKVSAPGVAGQAAGGRLR